MASQTLFPGVDYGTLGNTRRMPSAGDYLKQLMEVVKAKHVPGALINAATGNGDSDDARKLKTIFAFQNLMGITQINNLLVSGLYE